MPSNHSSKYYKIYNHICMEKNGQHQYFKNRNLVDNWLHPKNDQWLLRFCLVSMPICWFRWQKSRFEGMLTQILYHHTFWGSKNNPSLVFNNHSNGFYILYKVHSLFCISVIYIRPRFTTAQSCFANLNFKLVKYAHLVSLQLFSCNLYRVNSERRKLK